ncbi:FMN phosphatase YigB (HAD superfamily) [Saccharothrix violaceirubra]|uniref:FMN phosphatase YigB (HAD superfamily) n=1 Tax=Saccharothrix violaceirubra TaxID=413306 RepID=A0A7W7WU88_9PSEU|nr:FMN phosphatase YigB (HAD superfamily) [Saccharothrix violaceirubra]
MVFDVGETLVDDSREWGRWADWLGVPCHTLSAVVGAVTVAGLDNAEALGFFRAGFDVGRERRLREEAGVGESIEECDLYPDVREGLGRLRDAGLWVGVAGNQTARAGELLRGLGLPVDAVATSGEWGVPKPDPGFFARVVEMAGCAAGEVVHVGDHRDNDVVAAKAAGLRAVLIRRGPWGHLWADDPLVRRDADGVIDSIHELPELLAGG